LDPKRLLVAVRSSMMGKHPGPWPFYLDIGYYTLDPLSEKKEKLLPETINFVNKKKISIFIFFNQN